MVPGVRSVHFCYSLIQHEFIAMRRGGDDDAVLWAGLRRQVNGSVRSEGALDAVRDTSGPRGHP
jgi:hypothetical protein